MNMVLEMNEEKNMLIFEDFNTLQKVLPKYLKRFIGAGAYLSKEHRIDDNVRYFTIGNTYPAFVDRSENIPVIKFLNFPNIGTAIAEKIDDKVVLKLPDREELAKKLLDKYNSLIIRAENTLLDTTYKQIVKIPNVQVAMHKIKTILIDLEYTHQINILDYPKGERDRYKKYLEFLEDLEYVRKRDENTYVEGNKLSIIKHDLNAGGDEELYNKILAEILRRGYEYMSRHLNLLQIIPYLRIINAYYLPSFEFDRLLKINKRDVINFFSYYLKVLYKIRKKDYKLYPQIEDVIKSEILTEVNDHIVGSEEIYEEFYNKMEEFSLSVI